MFRLHDPNSSQRKGPLLRLLRLLVEMMQVLVMLCRQMINPHIPSFADVSSEPLYRSFLSHPPF
jgi:hypothetical protein